MDLRQLASLVAVAETGTFSAAATRLHTVQSNVSTHVARLEKELGVTLVDRAAGRLTAEGEVVVARARRVQTELEALTADVASLRDEVAGSVRLGIIGTIARWLMPPLLTAMAQRHPKVRILTLEANTTALLPQLVAGSLDIGVVNLPAIDPDVVVEPVFEEELILVAPRGHPLTDGGLVGVRQLAEHELLLTPPGTSIRVLLDEAAEAEGVHLRPKAELDGLRLIASMCFEGFGAGVVPTTAIPRWLTEGDWTVVPLPDLPRRCVALACRKRGLASAPSRVVQEVIRDVVADEAAAHPGVHPTG
ncbi:MAG: putative LysR family transcriptional regulator [Acidimicrobiales bacterium]|nr:putative LysR family transcriptional regulator [Acidimicrobiales bacterium]